MGTASTFASTAGDLSGARAGVATSCTLMDTPALVSRSLMLFHPSTLFTSSLQPFKWADLCARCRETKHRPCHLTECFVCTCVCVFAYSDIDECKLQNGGCSHTCSNSPGGHSCHCPLPLLLGADNITCTSTYVVAEIASFSSD